MGGGKLRRGGWDRLRGEGGFRRIRITEKGMADGNRELPLSEERNSAGG